MTSYRTPSGSVVVTEIEPGFFDITGPDSAMVATLVRSGASVPGPEGTEPASIDNVGLAVEFVTGERLVESLGT